MARILLMLLVCLAGVSASHAAASFTLENPDPAWISVVDQLRTAHPVRCAFTESRTNTFHRRPRWFDGTIRYAPEFGLSIGYEKPSHVVVIVTNDSIRIARGGQPEQLDAAIEHTLVLGLFSRLFAWDVAWLSRTFASHGQMDDAMNWNLELVPAEGTLSRLLSKLVLSGSSARLTRIHIDLAGGRTVTINLSDHAYPASFSADELHLAFPPSR